MISKLCSNRSVSRYVRAAALATLWGFTIVPTCLAGDAPGWMHALVSAPLPAHDEKTDAVLLLHDEIVNVQSPDKIKTVVREAYKILRPSGREYGDVIVSFHQQQKVNGLHGWCIPAQGKDYEVKDKDAVEVSLPKVEGSELVSDVKSKFLRIPAADPGNIVGYEYELEEQPYALQDVWYIQKVIPVRESHYRLVLPPGWEFKATWLNLPESKPLQSGNEWQWSVSDIKAALPEEEMPPWQTVAGQMAISFIPSGGAAGKSFSNWQQMGSWYADLTQGRHEPSPEIKQKVASLTGANTLTLAKMQAIATFVQKEIRYVAIELGIGGWQPHTAKDVFSWRYGDCKDKATLLSAMLQEIGIGSFYVVIHAKRGAVTLDTQPRVGVFNHAIVAIRLPDGLKDESLRAVVNHPTLGRLLFFDPTNELTPLGEIGGYLQDNLGLLVTPGGGELVKLPRQASETNSILRTAKLKLAPDGTLSGDFDEIRMGDRAADQRAMLRSVTKDTDRIKPIEQLLSHSISKFQITHASLGNLQHTAQPFEYHYSIVAPGYAKTAGDLLLVRPRVVGIKSSAVLETQEPRQFPVVFEGPAKDSDTFEIAVPTGYEVDDLPPPVNADYPFASYHSKTEFTGGTLRYTRTYELKEFSVPLNRIEDLKKFYRIVNGDERNTAVLRPIAN